MRIKRFAAKMDDDRPRRFFWFEDITSPPRVPGYKFLDTPDGEDCFKKMWFMTKWSTLAGVVLSTYDVLMYSHPKGYAAAAYRVGFFVVPFAFMGAAYTATTYISANLRKKDDHVNHLTGALAASSIYGACRKGVGSGFRMSLLLLPLAWIAKDSAMKNYKLAPMPLKGVGNFRSILRDYSLVPNDKPSVGPRE